MSLIKKAPQLVGLFAALTLAGACDTLNISNPNAPDSPRLLSDPATVQSIALGAMRTWYSTAQGPTSGADAYPGLTLNVMARSAVAAWNNYNIRFYTGCTNTAFTGYPAGSCGAAVEGSPYPRIEWQNNPASAQRTQIEFLWYGNYSALSSANDVLKAIRKNGVVITDATTTRMVETMAALVQALCLAELALNYDQAFVVTDSTPVNALGQPAVVLSKRAVVRDAAVTKFNQVIALTATTFSVPSAFFGGPAISYDNVKIKQIANTMAARLLAYYPRTAAENANISAGGQVDWTKVASYASQGISTGTPFDLVFHQDGCINWCDWLKLWSNDMTTMRIHTRLAHLLDPVSQEDPWPANNPNTALAAPITASVTAQAATPVAMQYIATGRQLTVGGTGVVIDTTAPGPPPVTTTTVFSDKEKVIVTATTATTFTGVFSKNHQATTLAAAITGRTGYQAATPVSMAGIQKASVIAIDTGSLFETVVVKSVTATTFTAIFGHNHAVNAVLGAPVHRNHGSHGNDEPSSPDHRLGDGTSRDGAAYASAILAANPDTTGNGGYDYVWSFDEEIQRTTRGLWHQSSIGQTRYDSLAGCGDNPEGLGTGVGDAPMVLAAENDLIWAEALLRQPTPNPGMAATLINYTHHGPDRLGRLRGGLPLATGTLAEVQYEQDVELAGESMAPFYNQRRIDNLEPLTPHEMPVPAKELGVLQLPLYTWGGSSNPTNSAATAPAPGSVASVVSAPQMWAEIQRHQRALMEANKILKNFH